MWCTKYLMLMRHNPPNATNPKAQISKLSAKSLYKQYTAWCKGAREVPLQKDGFRGLFYTIKCSLNIVMRTSKQGSAQCWFCALCKEICEDAPSFAEKGWVRDIEVAHVAFHAAETKSYEQDIFEGRDISGHSVV